MRLIPPIRTRRWIWLAITALITVAWVGSMRWSLTWRCGNGRWLIAGLMEGCLVSGWLAERGAHDPTPDGVSFQNWNLWAPVWLPHVVVEKDRVRAHLPLWIVLVASSALTVRSFRRARRLADRTTCQVCAYPLAGLAPNSPCPECGKP